MSGTLNLKTVKTKIHRTIVEDGLLDIMMGIYLILSGIFLNNRWFILNYLFLPIALVLIEVIRRRYVFPRTGYVKISLSALEIFTIFSAIVIVASIISSLIALIASSVGHPVEVNWREILSSALIFTLVISFCFIAYRFSVPRWYMHGISMGIVFALSKVFDAHGLLLGLGIWITLVGVFVLQRFINENPLESPDAKETPNAA